MKLYMCCETEVTNQKIIKARTKTGTGPNYVNSRQFLFVILTWTENYTVSAGTFS